MHVQVSMSVIQQPPVSVFYFYCFLFMFTSFYDPSLSIHFSVSWFAGKWKVNMQTLSSFIPNCQSHKTKQKTSFILCQFFSSNEWALWFCHTAKSTTLNPQCKIIQCMSPPSLVTSILTLVVRLCTLWYEKMFYLLEHSLIANKKHEFGVERLYLIIS